MQASCQTNTSVMFRGPTGFSNVASWTWAGGCNVCKPRAKPLFLCFSKLRLDFQMWYRGPGLVVLLFRVVNGGFEMRRVL